MPDLFDDVIDDWMRLRGEINELSSDRAAHGALHRKCVELDLLLAATVARCRPRIDERVGRVAGPGSSERDGLAELALLRLFRVVEAFDPGSVPFGPWLETAIDDVVAEVIAEDQRSNAC